MESVADNLTLIVTGLNLTIIAAIAAILAYANNRQRPILIVVMVLLFWFLTASTLAILGLFEAHAEKSLPLIAPAIVAPIIIAVLLFKRLKTLRTLLDSLPLELLVGIQFYRAIGLLFLILYWLGLIPGAFALNAGWGDLAVGLLAPVVAAVVIMRKEWGLTLTRLWNYGGMLDLIWAVILGFRTSPGPLQSLALDAPNLMITAYPLVLIPTFAVPLSFLLHLAVVVKLRRGDTTQERKRVQQCIDES